MIALAGLVPRDARDRMIVPLDLPSPDAARAMAERLGDRATFYKLGLELVYAGGLDIARELVSQDKRVFLDLKLLDIPNTVAGGVRSVSKLGASLLTVHAYPQAMRAAVGVAPASLHLLGVTVLTSLDDDDLEETGYAEAAPALVRRRARQARDAGMAGVVCSPLEIGPVREALGEDKLIVAPGIRPKGAGGDDQKRAAAPADAIRAGADFLVVGRPITKADDPADAAARITDEIERAL